MLASTTEQMMQVQKLAVANLHDLCKCFVWLTICAKMSPAEALLTLSAGW